MESARLVGIVEELGRPRILVGGDLMLDRYVWGKVERISPEAPIPIVRVDREEEKPGGAGSVVADLHALGAEVTVHGCVGADAAGERFLDVLPRESVAFAGLRVAGRPTTVKTRVIAGAQHVLRVDHEADGRYAETVEADLVAKLEELVPATDLVLVPDYNKGLLRGPVLRELAAIARRAGKRVLADPKKEKDYGCYRGLTAVTPNRAETELATGIAPRDPASWAAAARRLVQDLDLEAALVTLDRDGIFFYPRPDSPGGGGGPRHFPTQPRAVYDVTGAGDMVLSVIGHCLASGVGWADAIEIANVAAGLEVQRVGVAPLRREEIRAGILERDNPFASKIFRHFETFGETLAELRRQRKRIVFTNGCFDLLHVGHVKLLQFARGLGDALVVGLNTDRSVRAWADSARDLGLAKERTGRPVIGEEDRAHVLAALAAVDYVVLFDEPTPIRIIETLLPDVLVKGEDYKGKTVVGREAVEAAGGHVVLAPLVPGISTTEILRRMSPSPRRGEGSGEGAAGGVGPVLRTVEGPAS